MLHHLKFCSESTRNFGRILDRQRPPGTPLGFLTMDSTTPAKLSARQRQRFRQRSAQAQSRKLAEHQDRTHRREITRLTKTISDLRNSAEQMEAKLQALVRSSALDANSTLLLKEEIAHLRNCNKKWDREGARLLQENQRLRSERDRARSRNYPGCSASPCPHSSETSSPPLTPRTPGHYAPSSPPPTSRTPGA